MCISRYTQQEVKYTIVYCVCVCVKFSILVYLYIFKKELGTTKEQKITF